jgi:hypothetical protein
MRRGLCLNFAGSVVREVGGDTAGDDDDDEEEDDTTYDH